MSSPDLVFDEDGNGAVDWFKWGFRASIGDRQILFVLPSANIRSFLVNEVQFMDLKKLTDEQRGKIQDAIRAKFAEDDLGKTEGIDIELVLPIDLPSESQG